ncbi:hypothetical protein B0H14DRAFT_3706909 [Mycena olivaceomarginata]|nr:hypothetical protein B0H14DRAFT_3706909 [Mycena olivaceomarginata]
MSLLIVWFEGAPKSLLFVYMLPEPGPEPSRAGPGLPQGLGLGPQEMEAQALPGRAQAPAFRPSRALQNTSCGFGFGTKEGLTTTLIGVFVYGQYAAGGANVITNSATTKQEYSIEDGKKWIFWTQAWQALIRPHLMVLKSSTKLELNSVARLAQIWPTSPVNLQAHVTRIYCSETADLHLSTRHSHSIVRQDAYKLAGSLRNHQEQLQRARAAKSAPAHDDSAAKENVNPAPLMRKIGRLEGKVEKAKTAEARTRCQNTRRRETRAQEANVALGDRLKSTEAMKDDLLAAQLALGKSRYEVSELFNTRNSTLVKRARLCEE